MEKIFEKSIQKLNLEHKNVETLSQDLNDEYQIQFNKYGSMILGKLSGLVSILISEKSNFRFETATENYKILINNWFQKVQGLCYEIDYMSSYYSQLVEIVNDFKILRLFSFISTIESTVVLVGANGSGKSTLINHLRKLNNKQMYALPAQKFLYFSKSTFERNNTTVDSYRISLKNSILKTDNIEMDQYALGRMFTHDFSNLITLLVKDYTKIVTNIFRGVGEDEIPLWDKVESIWKKLIPEIEFRIDSDDRLIFIKKSGKEYTINSLSDGEKCILFYIGNVMLAPQKSYIVVDEPETFLNAAIYNELWDLLIAERSDCQFVFASHNIDFIMARNNATYVWCKNFTPPTDFDYEVLNNDSLLPITLQVELSGSRKPILFCEGEKDSLDYKIYSKLFSDKFFIKPVKGHKTVITYTEAYNGLSELHSNRAYGIVDYDWMSQARVDALQSKNVFTTPFNEIEMLLISSDVIDSVLGTFKNSDEIKQHKDNFYKVLSETCIGNRKKISGIALKKKIDEFVTGNLIQSSEPDLEQVQSYFSNFSKAFDAQGELELIDSAIDEACTDKNVDQVLKICNLKDEILEYRANTELDRDYRKKALIRLNLDKELPGKLVNKYFSDLLEKVEK